MTITANSGPTIAYGITLSSSGAAAEYNEDRGPSLNDLGEGTLDPRAPFNYKPGNRAGAPVFGWAGCFGGPVGDFVPIALSTNGIAATQSASAASGTLTLQTSANSSSFRLISGFVGSTMAVAYPVLMLDGYQNGIAVGPGTTTIPNSSLPQVVGLPFGQSGAIRLWDPVTSIGRCLTISSTGNDSANTYTITGFDVYGMLMTAKLAGPNNATVTTLKAFKYILSSGVSFSGGGSSAVQVGTADVYGFPLYVEHPAYATIWWGPSSGATLVSLSTGAHAFGLGSSVGFNLGSSVTNLSSLADVRGTFTSPAASNATAASSTTANRLTMNLSPGPNRLATVTQNSFWGLVGLSQV